MALDKPIMVMTVKEVAVYLRLHQSTVYRLVQQRKLPAFKIGSDLRFNKSQIEQLMADLSKPTQLPK